MSVVAMLQGHVETDTLTLESALALAGSLGAPLTALFALPDPQSALMVVTTPEATGLSAAAASSVIELQKEMLDKARTAYEAVAGSSKIQSELVHQIAPSEIAAAAAGTLAEALIFPRSAARTGEPLSLAFDHVLMDARLPVVLSGTEAFAPGAAVVGWDGSNGAARTVRFHSHLLTGASEVIIAQNRKDAERDGARPVIAPDSLKDWLSKRGIKARTTSVEGEVAAGLITLAKGSGASLILAGAYGHSRLAERIFGGTTKRLLGAESAPALALAR
jgi:nucleotide-binding universal stress UspA family protein